MENPLTRVLFTSDCLWLVQPFYSGEKNGKYPRYCKYVDDWIKGDEDTKFSALQCLRESETQLQVWLYGCPKGGLVGYGSLHIRSYSWFSGWDYHGPAFEIPKVAVQSIYQGERINDLRYADHVMLDLIEQARLIRSVIQTISPVIILWVDPENKRAKNFYKDHGFEDLEQTIEEDGIEYEGRYLVFE